MTWTLNKRSKIYIINNSCLMRASLVVQLEKNLPVMQETQVQSLVWKIPWRRVWQPTPVFLPKESPWIEEPGGLQSVGSQRTGHDWVTKHTQHMSYEHTEYLENSVCSKTSVMRIKNVFGGK